MSFGISSSEYPTASLAAILAIGNPVALLARALLRANPRVHLDHVEIVPRRIHRELDVRSPRLYPDLSYYAYRRVAEGLVLPVGEGLGGGDGYGVAGVDAHGVEVLDGADDDDVVGEVAHDLELELFPADDAPLDEDAAHGAGVEAVGHGAPELFGVVGRGAALTAQGEARADDEGEADLSGELQGFFDAVDDAALGDLEADALHRLAEEVPVLGLADGSDRRAEELDAVALRGCPSRAARSRGSGPSGRRG